MESTVLIIGLIIRLFFMPISAQSDIINFSWISHYISLGHFDVYKYLADNYPSITYSGIVNYPPAIYFLLGFWEFVLYKSHLLDIIAWHNPYDLYNLSLNTSVFLLKIPYLICDLVAGFAIIKLVDKGQRFLAFSLWFLNPITIFISYIQGQYDIIPTTCVIISLYFAKESTNFLDNERNRVLIYEIISILFLGLAASLKNFAFLLLPIYIIVLGGRNASKSMILGTLGVMPYVIFVIPFIRSPTFFNAVLNAPQNQSLFSFSLSVGYNHFIYIFFLLYFITLFYLFQMPKDNSFEAIWMYCLVVLSLLYITILWHPQWYVWITPFSILAIIKYKDYIQYYFIQIAYFAFYIMRRDNDFGARIFSPIYPYFVAGSRPEMNILVLSELKSMKEYISSIFNYDTFLGIGFSLFIALTIFFYIHYLIIGRLFWVYRL